MNYALVFVGAGLGGVMRHGLNSLAAMWFGSGFPVATVVVNVLGALFLGAAVEQFGWRLGAGEGLRLFLAVGVAGGFTTFSAFCADSVTLIEQGRYLVLLGYVAGSVGLGLGALVAGALLIRSLS